MMLFIAGLQQIPETLYEAANIDGASPLQQFWYVTIPGLRNVLVFIFLTITIAAFQLFDQVLVLTNGGPDNATTTTVFHMFRNGFREQNIAYASAIAVIFFLIIVLINVVQRYAIQERSA
jgi:ABC-type sugar transport system permease subunit